MLTDASARGAEVVVLSEYGAKARPARPLLLRRLRNKPWDIRLTSAELLATMAPADSGIRSAIERQRAVDPETHMRPRFEKILRFMEGRA